LVFSSLREEEDEQADPAARIREGPSGWGAVVLSWSRVDGQKHWRLSDGENLVLRALAHQLDEKDGTLRALRLCRQAEGISRARYRYPSPGRAFLGAEYQRLRQGELKRFYRQEPMDFALLATPEP
jgi:Mlc titration factor MtfA (ptsG expression regulator)